MGLYFNKIKLALVVRADQSREPPPPPAPALPHSELMPLRKEPQSLSSWGRVRKEALRPHTQFQTQMDVVSLGRGCAGAELALSENNWQRSCC